MAADIVPFRNRHALAQLNEVFAGQSAGRSCRSGSYSAYGDSVPGVRVLLPYLLGAASAFAVQFLIEIYVVPRVDTRKRREERWEKDVLDLGELLSTSVQEVAGKAHTAQWMVQLASSGQWIPEQDSDQLDGYLRKLKQDSQQATREFTDLIGVRAD